MTSTVTATRTQDKESREDVDDVGSDESDGAAECLGELVGQLPPLSLGIWLSVIDGRMPGAAEIAEAMVTELLRIETRQQTARDMVAVVDFGFGFMPDDHRSAQRAALADLDEAGEILEEVKAAVLRWLKAINSTRVVELDEETWPTLRESIASSVPRVRGHAAALVVEAAVEYLGQQPDVDWIVARAEQKRLEALRGESGGEPRARRYWPWTKVSGQPWPAAERKDNGSTAKGHRRSSRGANTTVKRVQHAGRKGKTA